MDLMDPIRSWKEPLVDEWAQRLGAKCEAIFPLTITFRVRLIGGDKIDVRPDGVWDDFHITDGRIVTGTNPQSARSTAEAAVAAFKTL